MLRDTQSALLSYITGLPSPGGGDLPDVAALVESDARADARERLAVYAYMYRARVVEALESQYPRLARVVGAERFADLTAAYAADHPSRDPSLRSLGERLPDWLEGRRACAPWLADLARLEWARADVFDAADEPLLAVEALRAWPAERFGDLPLKLAAAHRLVTVDYAIADAWDAAGGDAAWAGEGADAPAAAGETLLVWRQGTTVYHRVAGEEEAAALALAARGSSFGVICEALASAGDQAAAAGRAFAWLSTWLADELLVAVAA